MRFAALIIVLCSSPCWASDAIVTLQYHSPNALFAAGTSRLSIETVGPICEAFPNAKDHVVNTFEGQLDKLPPEVLAKNYTDAKAALQALGTGALLVLNCHSSIEKVGVPNEKGETVLIPWAGFWNHFGIEKPPKLALVCLNGCVGKADENGVKGEAADGDLERLRRWLSAQALVSGTRSIATEETQGELANVMTKLKSEEGKLGGWDVDLGAEKGLFKVAKALKIRAGPLYSEKVLTVNGLKRQAVTFARPSLVKASALADVVFAREDDADAAMDPADAVKIYDTVEDKPEPGCRPFRFDWKPRGEILRVEFELTVMGFAPDAVSDRAVFDVGGELKEIRKDFGEFAKAEGKAVVKFPSDEQLKANPSAALKVTDPALFAQATTGKLRCAIGDHVWLRSANVTVTYAAAK